jgi:S-adenosylmethionine:tRNA ribosyltransferase-isomerase
LTELGETPIPKYISRDVTPEDGALPNNYAKEEGAVAPLQDCTSLNIY